MAKARQIVKRRKAVRNIRKITQTMQLIATARYQRCLQRAQASQPYTQKITEMIQTLAQRASVDHPLLRANPDSKRGILLIISSNRGLAGAYNANVLRAAVAHRRMLEEQGLQVELEVAGKKGINYLRFLRFTLDRTITDLEDRIAFDRVAEMAERYMSLYEKGELARVDIAYTRFHSVGLQRAEVVQLLPIEPPQAEGAAEAGAAPAGAQTSAAPTSAAAQRRVRRPAARQVEFEFSPAPQELLARLIPESVKIRLFQYFNDAIVSEQVSRMVAMKAATDAAGDMIKYLTREYNRARQSQITLELADIVGGAEAVR